MIELTIPRPMWSRGKQTVNALLVDQALIDWHDTLGSGNGSTLPQPKVGTMCCLGHLCIKLGLTPDEIKGRGMPQEAVERLSGARQTEVTELLSPLLLDKDDRSTEFADDAAETNDSAGLSEEQREEILIEKFARNGVKLSFTDEYEPTKEV